MNCVVGGSPEFGKFDFLVFALVLNEHIPVFFFFLTRRVVLLPRFGCDVMAVSSSSHTAPFCRELKLKYDPPERFAL